VEYEHLMTLAVPHFELTNSGAKGMLALIEPGQPLSKIALLAVPPYPDFVFRLPAFSLVIRCQELYAGSGLYRVDAAKADEDSLVSFELSFDGESARMTPLDSSGSKFDAAELPTRARELAFSLADTTLRFMAYLSCPKLIELEVLDFSKLNKKRELAGKPAKPSVTVVRPSLLVREYLSGKPPSGGGDMPEHWVRGHWRHVWCGPKDQPQRPEPRWILPFTRGNPENGTKPPNYLVKG